MKKHIIRNIALLSAIFAVVFGAMLLFNFFTIRGAQPLETVEKIKQLAEANPDLVESLREIDLLARRAYFVSRDHLMVGVYILIATLATFVTALRLYFADLKHLPDKDIDPIDEWAVKSLSRRWLIGASVAIVAVIVCLSLFTFERDVALPAEQTELAQVEQISVEKSFEQVSDQIKEDVIDEPPRHSAEQTTGEEPQVVVSKITSDAFRGNNSLGQSAAQNVPTKWSVVTGENILWKVDIPRRGYSSPVVNGNRVFVTGADDQARELYCYELSSGKLLWSLRADNIPGSPATMPKTTGDTGLAASTCATNGTQVAAIFASGDIIAADMEGKRLWAKNLGVPDNHYGYASSLLINGNTLYIQYDNAKNAQVIALDAATGSQRWSKTRTKDKIAWSSPIISPDNQLILMGNPAVTAYNPANGAELWRVECMSGEVGSSPVAVKGVVYGASEYATLIAISAADGSTLWKADDYLPEVASVVATKDFVFVATSYGVVACYGAADGSLVGERDLKEEFYSSPMLVGGRMFLVSNSGKMYVLSANEKLDIVSNFDTGVKTFATPAFTDNRVVVRGDGVLYCAQRQ